MYIIMYQQVYNSNSTQHSYTWSGGGVSTIWGTANDRIVDIHCDTAFVSREHTQSSNVNSSFCDAVRICTLCPTHHIISIELPIELLWLHPLH